MEILSHYKSALKMQKEYHPSNHVAIANILKNIGICHEFMNRKQIALTVYEKFLPIEHPDRQLLSPNENH